MAHKYTRTPRFTTLQLFLISTLAGLVAGLVTSAWQWGWVLVDIDDVGPGESPHQWRLASGLGSAFQRFIYVGGVPIDRRIVRTASFIAGFAIWAAIWGIARKRGRESLARIGVLQTEDYSRQRLPTPSPPLAMTACWGLMVIGGLVALAIPIVLMFMIGPLLFPTIYFSLFVGLAAIARGAARDSANLKRTAGLQLANMIALDPTNIIFAAMEFALLRTGRVKAYLQSTMGSGPM